ncbi:MAG: putative rRNA maturation factor [Actinomycetota bacterium]|nr:putative rRNA maturation factor [Actinomycetota bacterium]
MSIEVANESGVDVDEARLASIARFVLAAQKVHPLAELSILLMDEPSMESLHVKWMDEPGPTDVMAFPMDDLDVSRGPGDDADAAPTLLGDVVICPQFAAAQASKAGHSLEDELAVLCTHGVLHLLGYDHADPEDEKVMFGLTDELLAQWRRERGPQT